MQPNKLICSQTHYDSKRKYLCTQNRVFSNTSDALPNLRKKFKRPDELRLSYECMVSMTLSYLGGTRVCDLCVLHLPIKNKAACSYFLNAIDAINETHKPVSVGHCIIDEHRSRFSFEKQVSGFERMSRCNRWHAFYHEEPW